MTDNGAAYRSRPSARPARPRASTHKRTRPYTPRTNGKAERFIQTSLREWAASPRCGSGSRGPPREPPLAAIRFT